MSRPAPARTGALLAAVAVLAATMRVVPVLRGGGFDGALSYDGSVYYAAAAGVAHGLLPYRDFLLLHPPGITVALLPFALLGRLLGDADGLAVARAAFVLLGAANAVLVARVLAPQGRRAAAVGGCCYAVFFPAVFVERATSLEAVATTCLLGSLLLLTRRPGTVPDRTVLVLAGALLGAGAGVKIWGVVVGLGVIGWSVAAFGPRRGAVVTAGAAAGVSAVCLPFFLAAPGPMWRMVVLDQLARPRSSHLLSTRLADIAGLSILPAGVGPLHAAVVAATVVGAAGAVLLALRSRTGRLAVVVLVSCLAVLLSSPTWFLHYAGLSAAPVALVVGAGAAGGGGLLPGRRSRLVAATAVVATLATSGLLVATTTFGTSFPGPALATAARGAAGCVTADDPTSLIESNLLGRNLDRGCPLVVDLGGYSYDLPGSRTRPGPRSHDRTWQAYALRYLRSGSLAVCTRFRRGTGFSHVTATTVRHWAVVGHAGRYRVQQPGPPASG